METLPTKSCRNLPDLIAALFQRSGLSLDSATAEKLLFYFTELHKWNKVINLTGIREPEGQVIKHLGDTLLLLSHMDIEAKTVLDIGTGPGVPGLIMKIIRPDLYMVLAESVRKKCSFLRFICASLNLNGIYIEEKRIAHDKQPDHLPANGFDLIVSQAAGSIKWFVKTGLDFVCSSGSMILLKGPAGKQELDKQRGFLESMGLYYSLINTSLPMEGHQRLLIFLKKRQTTEA